MAISWLNILPCRQEAGSLLQLLMSDSTGPEGPRNLYLFERWCPLVLIIEGEAMCLICCQISSVGDFYAKANIGAHVQSRMEYTSCQFYQPWLIHT